VIEGLPSYLNISDFPLIYGIYYVIYTKQWNRP
jgi:hypothetical protein